MTILVHGATGAQGSPVLSALQAAGVPAVAAVRNTQSVPDGVASVSIDLADPEALTAAYADATGVFVHLPMGPPEQTRAQAEAIAQAITDARPARVVISTSGVIVDEPGSPLQAPADHPLVTLIDAVAASGVSCAVVAPRLYLENLLLPVVHGPARETGILRYPLPAAYPVSWSSHRDVAEVVVRLLTDPAVTGTVAVGHLPGLEGADLAAAFAAQLGREVRFEGITPEQFGELITPIFGPAAAPVVALYEALNTQDRNTIAAESSAQQRLGLTPRSVTHWLREVGQ
ncbi:uncharacterized protein YbjT (DUF2867 family) [Leucobacter luti]|uniref:SDR family oxidoreductase n=1 Tax=Leucobacter luti TaxID=340320 RepID=UPI001050C89A|nr:NmrA family NAD(P)-binding protein [Leucobacter luti]MCW2289387.1 uncharacterized protein YbjT (DUF2867 family) [Leucobacter luti]TCK39947.1 uncharacterized protein YbjT (DUF2867 family) [Leucobacter luti]